MIVTSFRAASPAELDQFLATQTAPAGYAPVAVVFASIQHDVAEVQAVFARHAVRVCGSSTAGEIVDGELCAATITGMLFHLEATAFRCLAAPQATIREQAEFLGRTAAEAFADPQVILFVGGLMTDGEEVIAGMFAGAGRPLGICGGLAADDFAMTKTYGFTEDTVRDEGLVALILDGDQIEVYAHAMSGWEPMGIEQTITSAEGNVIHEINGQPALEFVYRFFGDLSNQGFTGTEVSVVNSQYPLQLQRPGGAVLRAPTLAHPNGMSVVMGGGVHTGETFRFSIAPGFEVIDATSAFFAELRRRGLTPDALIMVSCKGRHAAFGPMLEDEIAEIAGLYGVPMAGYLSYGEIGVTDGGTTALHNNTCCVITLRERPRPVDALQN